MLHIGDCLINLLEVDAFVSSGTKVVAVMKSGAKVSIDTTLEEIIRVFREFTGIRIWCPDSEPRGPVCKYCVKVYMNPIGEKMVLCDRDGLCHNVTLGDCFGNCEHEKV